ncbi:MAG: nucleotidyltransferase domain-containing protein [Candidatus Sumerlaeia bacterium]|nr:nucleotidyltransferase domain-containing protein [Candidatus Sumerlaeia bacterium]
MTTPAPITDIPSNIRRAADVLHRFGASEVYLFGSRARGQARAHSDVDLAVRGLAPESFYRAVGEVLCELDVPVDVVDLDETGPLMELLRAEGDFRRVI